MAQHMLLLAAARSKTVRRLVGAAVGLFLMLILGIVFPLVAVPAVIAGPSLVNADVARPTVVGGWAYPLAGSYFTSDGFGWRSVDDCSYCSSDHRGYDMSQECGATIYAAGPGTVIRAGAWGTFGNAVQIDHGGGVTTIYGHMLWGSLSVESGMKVAAGIPLGLEGRTGASTACHLHFEVRVGDVAIDPEPFMAERGLPLR
ncbi:murein DD-endopeptidase MepM/ murein hydrolase activator NlpD [Salinibacterium sp. CAN_S4]|uniref:M23 family metallopeptidase n=1 Tax=Salinibacterium sp. CAN_S4 TaxID=2787727 RepID=UPI0018F010D2